MNSKIVKRTKMEKTQSSNNLNKPNSNNLSISIKSNLEQDEYSKSFSETIDQAQ